MYDPTFESVANLDDLQRSWETLKNVVGGPWETCGLIYYFRESLSSGFFSESVQFVFYQISEKQRSLYEALEKQQHYQGSLQSISSKMEALEDKLSEPLEPDRSPDSHIRAHEVSHCCTIVFFTQF